MTQNVATLDSASSTSQSSPSASGLNIGLWVAQGLLAFAFGMAGLLKLTTPIAQLAEKMPWAADLPALVRFIGASEFAGALGMILPPILRIKPSLTPLAGLGLLTIMILAALFHASRGEFFPGIAINALLGGLALFVAWGRSRKVPISPRS